MRLHYILQHLDRPGTYVRILFLDFPTWCPGVTALWRLLEWVGSLQTAAMGTTTCTLER